MIKQFIIGGLLVSFLGGCGFVEHYQFHDPALKLQKEDFEEITKPPALPETPPAFQPLCSYCPQAPFLTPGMKKNISLTVHEGILLRDVFLELGQQAGVGIALSPETSALSKGITYKANKMPFIEVVKDICQLTNHRFQIQGNRLLIEPDVPYLATYSVQFLSHTRKSENRISVSTDVFSPLESKKGEDNGSNSVLMGNTLVDFWAELEQNLKMILGSFGKGPVPYTLHKQGGLIIISGTAKQHHEVCEYLKKLKQNTTAQVLIEAKIIEVTLDNAYKTGINWNHFGKSLQLKVPLGPLNPAQLISEAFTFAVNIEKFASVLSLVKKFGTVRTLSNPRITVMNNQPAMLKVATNEVFFHLEFERLFQAEGKPDVENISSNPMTVPIGLVLVVQPSVNLQTGEITLILRPTISRVQKEVEDPAVAIKSQQMVKSSVPVVQVRELDSVLKMKSGQVLVMGGLMEDRTSCESDSLPGIESIPLIGEFVKGKEDERQVTELVIFLTAHIIEDPHVVDADIRIYNTYTEDPRPLSF